MTAEMLGEYEYAYQYHATIGTATSRYLSPILYPDAATAIRELALQTDNTAMVVWKVRVKPGTVVMRGEVANQSLRTDGIFGPEAPEEDSRYT